MRSLLKFSLLTVIVWIGTIHFSQAQAVSGDAITASVSCRWIGSVNDESAYQYEATLTNNTQDKLIVDYTILMKSGDMVKKRHVHSTLLIPNESLTETNTAKMSDADWDSITICIIEWSARKQP